jgi:hypothetical protein
MYIIQGGSKLKFVYISAIFLNFFLFVILSIDPGVHGVSITERMNPFQDKIFWCYTFNNDEPRQKFIYVTAIATLFSVFCDYVRIRTI